MTPRIIVIAALLSSACTVQRWQPSNSARLDDHFAHMSASELRPSATYSPAASGNQGAPGLPASALTAAERLKASPRHAEWVALAWTPGSKDSLMAWIVYPTTTRSKSAVVVVVHEIFGLTTWVRSVADQMAADGFIAIAPDLESRVRGGPSTDELSSDSATKLIRGIDIPERNRGIMAAANFAMSQPSAEKRYAVIGYCWGGSTVWGHAVDGGKGLAAGVAFYGGVPYMNGPVPVGDSLAKIRVPIMLLNGSKDARIAASMPAVDSTMKALHKNYSGTNYDGAVHGFLRAQNDPKTNRDPVEETANMAAVRDAWPRTIAFLRKNLAVK